MLSQEKLKTLENIFNKYSEVIAVYLFGSFAEGRDHSFSDLDLGVLLDYEYKNTIKLDILADLADQNFCNVDIIILNQAGILSRFEAVKHNKLIYKKEDFDFSSYYSRVIREFQDFRYLLKIQSSYLKERLLNG